MASETVYQMCLRNAKAELEKLEKGEKSVYSSIKECQVEIDRLEVLLGAKNAEVATIHCCSLSEFARQYLKYGDNRIYEVVIDPLKSLSEYRCSQTLCSGMQNVDLKIEYDPSNPEAQCRLAIMEDRHQRLSSSLSRAVCTDIADFWDKFNTHKDVMIYDLTLLSTRDIDQVLLKGYSEDLFPENFIIERMP